MVRAGFLRSMGHIDERYGNYGSEIEICAAVKSSGRKLLILKDVAAEHDASLSAVPASYLEGDRIAGTTAYLGKHHGSIAGVIYRLKSSLKALFTFRFRALAAAKIDGWG
jgi:GT2 family glycosyltransferase